MPLTFAVTAILALLGSSAAIGVFDGLSSGSLAAVAVLPAYDVSRGLLWDGDKARPGLRRPQLPFPRLLRLGLPRLPDRDRRQPT